MVTPKRLISIQPLRSWWIFVKLCLQLSKRCQKRSSISSSVRDIFFKARKLQVCLSARTGAGRLVSNTPVLTTHIFFILFHLTTTEILSENILSFFVDRETFRFLRWKRRLYQRIRITASFLFILCRRVCVLFCERRPPMPTDSHSKVVCGIPRRFRQNCGQFWTENAGWPKPCKIPALKDKRYSYVRCFFVALRNGDFVIHHRPQTYQRLVKSKNCQ